MVLGLRAYSQGGLPDGGGIPTKYTGDPKSELRAEWCRDTQARGVSGGLAPGASGTQSGRVGTGSRGDHRQVWLGHRNLV